MKYFALFILYSMTSLVFAGQAESWVNSPSININEVKLVKRVPAAQIFEVPTSLLEAAVERLHDSPAIRLENYDVDFLSRSRFSCSASTHPFLVRAVYENGGMGGYHLQRVDSALWVSHASRGTPSERRLSALLVCLDFQPAKVFVTSGGASGREP